MTPQNRLYEVDLSKLSEARQLVVIGDIHGDFEIIRKIRDLFDPERNCLIFLGDYADRGPEGIEVIDGVRELVSKHPRKVVALKGNHEDYTRDGKPRFMPCDLVHEASEKRGGWRIYFKDELSPFIDSLYLAALVQDEVLFLHGGISSKVKSIDDLRNPSRHVEEDILWSDPFEGEGEHPNIRGAGVEFGNEVSEEVCSRLGVKRIVRSHQPTKAMEGPCLEHSERIVTISSTTVYGGTPFILALPTNNLGKTFKHLKRYAINFR